MKTIEAYKCNYCDKVYQLKKSCQTHENRCYKNPRTKSCASCIFLKQNDYQYHKEYCVSLFTCLRNHDVTQKLKTACINFRFINERFDLKEMELMRSNYNPLPFIQPMIERMREMKVGSNADNHIGNLE